MRDIVSHVFLVVEGELHHFVVHFGGCIQHIIVGMCIGYQIATILFARHRLCVPGERRGGEGG